MTLDYKKKKKMEQNGGFEKKIKILLKNLMVFGLEKLYFPFNHVTGESFYRKKIHNKLRKDSSRSDDLLSSYSCSKFEKCSNSETI